jgi:DNA-binding Xre family transcriptional regulator
MPYADPPDPDPTIHGLTPTQADGFDCVNCGLSYIHEPVPHVPVGRSDTGSQVFACRDDCASEIPKGQSAMVDPGEMSAFARAVALALRAERLRRGWTMKEMGEAIGLCASAMSRIECGIRPVDMSRLVAFCAVLGVAPALVIAAAQAQAFPLGWPYEHEHRVNAARPCDSC